MLDHVIALNEQHLWRLIRDYVTYHHHDGSTIPSLRTRRIDGQWKASLRRLRPGGYFAPTPQYDDYIHRSVATAELVRRFLHQGLLWG